MLEIATQHNTENVSPSGVPAVAKPDSTTKSRNFQYLTTFIRERYHTWMSGSGIPAFATAPLAGSRGMRLKHFTRSNVRLCHSFAPGANFTWLTANSC